MRGKIELMLESLQQLADSWTDFFSILHFYLMNFFFSFFLTADLLLFQSYDYLSSSFRKGGQGKGYQPKLVNKNHTDVLET